MNDAGPVHCPRPGAMPERARVLHIGLAKTGTTSLQSTAAARRADLLAAGVRYPGGGLNHRESVSALMGRRWGWIGLGAVVPTMRHWDRLLSEVEAETERRVWISHEFASESTDEVAARFGEALGARLQVVITLRPFAAILPSSWQQYLKGGSTHTFEHWLRRVLADPPDTRVTPSFHLRNDQAGVVRRWAAVVGPERVTAVIVDKADPTRMTDAFEGLFDLPAGFLVDEQLGGLQRNRSMSRAESELIRQLNLRVAGREVDWNDYETLLRKGAIARLLESRTPAPGEGPLLLPEWAADRAHSLGVQFAESIRGSGVRLIGDVQSLAEPVSSTKNDQPTPTTIALDLAVEPLAGMLSAALGRGSSFAPVDVGGPELTDRQRAARAISGIRAGDLASVLLYRARHGLIRQARRLISREQTK